MSASLHKTLRAARGFLLSNVAKLSDEDWTRVPDGYSNNILWNVGHLVYSHNRLTYGACGLDTLYPPEYEELFKGGSSPATWPTTPAVADVRHRFQGQMEQIIVDHGEGKFTNFKPYKIAPGYSLDNIEDALQFVLFHESLHIEAIAFLKKALKTA